VVNRTVAGNVVFLVHALQEPYPERGSSTQQAFALPVPCLSVRGDFSRRRWFAFDCSDLSIERKVSRSVSPEPTSISRPAQNKILAVAIVLVLLYGIVVHVLSAIHVCIYKLHNSTAMNGFAIWFMRTSVASGRAALI
jgi:hypothetical protein